MSRHWCKAQLWIIPVLVCLVVPAWGQKTFTPDQIDFYQTKVRPLLNSQCLMCHNNEKRTNGLSLESREALLTGGNRGPAAEPGKPESSRLIQAVEYATDLKMPPTGKLGDEEIARLKRWVEMGLPWVESESRQAARPAANKHWAFQPPQHFPEPKVTNFSWVRNPIDSFILARLEREGLRPSPEADKVTLVRRLY